MSDTERLTIRIDSELKMKLKMISLKEGKSLGKLLEPAIAEYIKNNKEYLD